MDKHVFAGTPGDLGAAHGSRWSTEIRELAALRTRLTAGWGDQGDEDRVLALAALHLPVLESFDAGLYEELLACAAAAGVTPAQLVVVNHYTDLRDIRRPVWGPLLGHEDPGGCSIAMLPESADPDNWRVTGQTWDMHASAAAFVRLVEVRPTDGPNVTLLTLTGCLGMAGLNEAGVSVLINNLTSTDARIGVLWCGLVRRMLRETTARGAFEVLRTAPLGSGHHYLISDGRESFAMETSGGLRHELTEGRGNQLLHTNHCLAPGMQATERVPPTSTTYVRYEHIERRTREAMAQRAGITADEMAAIFRSHEGHPRSLCVHMSTPETPHKPSTCGAVAFDHRARRVLAVQGCTVDGQWVATEVGSDDVVRIDP